jgi:hypothetical protein
MGKPGTAVPDGQAGDSRVRFWGRHSRSRVDTDSYTQTVDGRCMTHKDPNILIHVVCSTRKRRDLIPREIQPRLLRDFAASDGITDSPCLPQEGTSNHSYRLIVVPSDTPVARAVLVLKGELLALARRTWLGFCVAGGIGIRGVQRQ